MMENPIFSPGTYSGSGQGKNGKIVLSISVNRHAITSIDITSHNEDTSIASNAIHYLPMKIVATQNLDIDAVSGATQTSQGIISAAQEALKKAGDASQVLKPNMSTLDNVVQHMTPGTYTAKAQGKWKPGTTDGARFGAAEKPQLLEVAVTVDESHIKEVKLLSCTDNGHFIKPVLQRMIPDIVAEQSVFVDVVSGATCTSSGVLKATTECLEQAGGNILGFIKTKPRETSETEYSCDVCIVGGGHSGTVAALMAIEQGASVVVVEKSGRIGGRGFCPSGVSAADAKIEKEAGITLNSDDFFEQLYKETKGRANNLLIRAIVDDSGPMIDWLIDHGFKGTPPKTNTNPDEAFTCDFGRGQEKFQALYDNYIIPMGGRVLMETRATELIEDNGKVTGVKATVHDGTQVFIHCKSVIIGTGGFGGNPQLLQRLCYSSNFYDRGLTTQCSGDGLLMCENVGAQLGPEIMPHMQEYAANTVCNFTDKSIKYITYGGFLTVNQEGKRFMNECLNVEDAMGSGCASLRVQGGAYYYIIDQKQVDCIQEKGVGGYYQGKLLDYLHGSIASRALVPILTLQEDLNEAIEKKQAWKANSVEELAEAIGFCHPEVFIQTFNRYNELCRKGQDTDFGKIPQMMNEHTMPCYAIRSVIPIMGTLGGIKVNERLEVLNKQDQVIDGLYIAGQEGSGFYTYPYYSTRCTTTTYAYCSGRLAGKYASEHALAQKHS